MNFKRFKHLTVIAGTKVILQNKIKIVQRQHIEEFLAYHIVDYKNTYIARLYHHVPKHDIMAFFFYLTLVTVPKPILLHSEIHSESHLFQAFVTFDISNIKQIYTSREHE